MWHWPVSPGLASSQIELVRGNPITTRLFLGINSWLIGNLNTAQNLSRLSMEEEQTAQACENAC